MRRAVAKIGPIPVTATMRHPQGTCHDGPMPLTVLIVDDHEAFRRSARELLEMEGWVVVGEASDGAGALRDGARLRPDLVLLDIQLPDIDGFVVAERLAAGIHPPAVVLISSRDADAYGSALEAAPARGFLPKRLLSGAALADLMR
jgi:DNA-binding NarL/FixJ family response regulator